MYKYKSEEFVNRLRTVGWTDNEFFTKVEFTDFQKGDMVALKIMLDVVNASPTSILTPSMVRSLKEISLRLAVAVILIGENKPWPVSCEFMSWCSLLVYLTDAISDIVALGPEFENKLPMFVSLHDRLEKFLSDIVEKAEAECSVMQTA